MNKIILIPALLLACTQVKVYAQAGYNDLEAQKDIKKHEGVSATAKAFDLEGPNQAPINIRDFVTLKSGKMMLELNSVEDFDRIKNMDSILGKMRNDLAFYKDSIEANNPGNVRIDYVLHEDQKPIEIRFKRYKTDGDLFVNNNDETARLKTEQDTVRIVMHLLGKEITGKTKVPKGVNMPGGMITSRIQYTIYATFYLDNYSDLDKILATPGDLRKIVDTLAAIQKPGTRKNPYAYPSSAVYKPYAETGKWVYKHESALLKNENDMFSQATFQGAHTLEVTGDLGISAVMNTIVPMVDMRIVVTNMYRPSNREPFRGYYGLSFSPYFFFNKDAQGNQHVYGNWFVNAETGTGPSDKDQVHSRFIRTFGVGYLFRQEGNYFHGATFKVFSNVKVHEHVSLSPELIMTGNFSQIFPGLGLKVFL